MTIDEAAPDTSDVVHRTISRPPDETYDLRTFCTVTRFEGDTVLHYRLFHRPARPGAFAAKLALLAELGLDLRPLALRHLRPTWQRYVIEQADRVWQLRIKFARVRRGLTVTLPELPGTPIAESRLTVMLGHTERRLASLIARRLPGSADAPGASAESSDRADPTELAGQMIPRARSLPVLTADGA